MPDVLIFADSVVSPEMRHEVPVLVPDPFLYAEKEDGRVEKVDRGVIQYRGLGHPRNLTALAGLRPLKRFPLVPRDHPVKLVGQHCALPKVRKKYKQVLRWWRPSVRLW